MRRKAPLWDDKRISKAICRHFVSSAIYRITLLCLQSVLCCQSFDHSNVAGLLLEASILFSRQAGRYSDFDSRA
jgi:hypothetical protein